MLRPELHPTSQLTWLWDQRPASCMTGSAALDLAQHGKMRKSNTTKHKTGSSVISTVDVADRWYIWCISYPDHYHISDSCCSRNKWHPSNCLDYACSALGFQFSSCDILQRTGDRNTTAPKRRNCKWQKTQSYTTATTASNWHSQCFDSCICAECSRKRCSLCKLHDIESTSGPALKNCFAESSMADLKLDLACKDQ